MASNTRLSELFQRKDAVDLLEAIPECEGFKMVSSLNESFELLEEKISTMTDTIVSAIDRNGCLDVSVLDKIIVDCDGMCSLIRMQQLKCFIIKNRSKSMLKMTAEDAKREHQIMQRLFPGGKRKFPQTPSVLKEKKWKTCDQLIEGVHRSVFQKFLFFPSPAFKASQLVSEISAGNFIDNHLKTIMTILERDAFIKVLPLEAQKDYLIVRETRSIIPEEHFKKYGLKREEYLSAAVPRSICVLKHMVECIDQSVITRLDNELWNMMSEIVFATILRDNNNLIPYTDLPNNIPKSVLKATTSLVQFGIISVTHLPELTFIKTGKPLIH